jgi:hypothetical protein
MTDTHNAAMQWRDIASAPKDGTPFLALNHDREVWVTRYDDSGRIMFRTHGRHEPRKFTIVKHNGEDLLREDRAYAEENECWQNNWTLWTRLYEFTPTHWMPLPPPPTVGGTNG